MRTTKTGWEVTVESRGADDNYSGFRCVSLCTVAQESGSAAIGVARAHAVRAGASGARRERVFRTTRTASRA